VELVYRHVHVYIPDTPPLTFEDGTHSKRENIISIQQDSKTIVHNSVAIPLTATATGLEVVANLSDTGLSILRGSPKFLGDVVGIFGTFVSGAINHDATPQEAERIYQDLTLEKMM
jgi:hypothetical protein